MADQVTTADPVVQVGEKMEQACCKAKEKIHQVKDKIAAAVPNASQAASKGAYGTCYYVGYGVAYGVLYLGGLIPKNNAAVHGLRDGAAAARDSLRKRREEKATKA